MRKSTELIQETASDICVDLDTSGKSQEFSIQGDAEAKVKGLATKLLDAGISGGANLNNSEYANVLQDQLADQLTDVRGCKKKIWEDLAAIVFKGIEPAESRIVVPPTKNTFTMKAGETRDVTPDDLIFTLAKVGYGGRSDLIRVSLEGEFSILSIGKILEISYSGGICKLYMTKMELKLQTSEFSLRC